ncbi:hypothetical protein KIW84_075751 [Lathyrus oleraceus]|uniref:Retroviral polymerase SH3-like domain-containing protein n=1 Tax=Pisum sativum TaxID=3888 RepID=A0A9D5A1F8_PEA|nr:hypothetical protein KIW84_075751 [Pisum sativum]
MKIFGCLCYAHNQQHDRDKFASRSHKCIFVGYPYGKKGWKLYDLETKEYIVFRDVKFSEHEFPFAVQLDTTYFSPTIVSDIKYVANDIGLETYDASIGGGADEGVCVSGINGKKGSTHEVDGAGVVVMQEDNVEPEEQEVAIEREAIMTPEIGRGSSTQEHASAVSAGKEPKNFKEVVKDSAWRDVMCNEIQALENNETWVMEKLSPEKKALGSNWVARNHEGIYLCQQKYVLEINEETGLLGAKLADFPMEQHHKLSLVSGKPIEDPKPYRRLIGRLIYLSVTRSYLAYSVHILSQFMQQLCEEHLEAALRVVRYLKKHLGQGILLRYDMSWKTKKQPTVSRSSVEDEYRSMAVTTCELKWLKQLLGDLGVSHSKGMRLYCDSQPTLHIAQNLVFHERTKHIEADCHFVHDTVMAGIIFPLYVPTSV